MAMSTAARHRIPQPKKLIRFCTSELLEELTYFMVYQATF